MDNLEKHFTNNRLPQVGDRVKFLGASKEQIAWGGNDDPHAALKVGEEFEVRFVEVHSWHTKIQLIGIIGNFNSVSFEIID